MSRPTLSIVVPVWNEERRLPGCLERLEAEADAAAAAAGSGAERRPRRGRRLDRRHGRDPRGVRGPTGAVQVPPLRARQPRQGRSRAGGNARRRVGSGTDDRRRPVDATRRAGKAGRGDRRRRRMSRSAPAGSATSNVLVHQPWYRELAGKTFNLTDPAGDAAALAGHAVRVQALPTRNDAAAVRAPARRRLRLRRRAARTRAPAAASRCGRCRCAGSTTPTPTSAS